MMSGGWFSIAEPPEHQAAIGGFGGFGVLGQLHDDCLTPELRAHIEQKIAEYEAKTGAAHFSRQIEPEPYPFFPQAGILWQDLFINNFVDLDPGSGIRDWDCSQYTYNGHPAWDSDIRSFQEQVIGVPVFAALDGTVVETRDGEFDMNTYPRQTPPNYVILSHGNSHYSWYIHLKKDSVAVATGQFVTAGTQLGLTGSSGPSTNPHLHFQSMFEGNPYEPSAGRCRPGPSYWVHQTPIRRDLYLRGFSLSNVRFDSYAPLPFDDVPRTGTFVAGAGRLVSFRIQPGNLPANSTWRIRFRRPDGTIALDTSSPFYNSFYRESWWWWSYTLDLTMVGTWKLMFDISGRTLIEAPFDVVASASLIVNRPPNPITMSFDPSMPTENDAIFCRVQNSLVLGDPDSDIVRYRYQWSLNGAVVRDVTTAALSDAMAKGVAQASDSVTCTVTPSDGKASGPAVTASLVVSRAFLLRTRPSTQ
jgi:hypothetical protein